MFLAVALDFGWSATNIRSDVMNATSAASIQPIPHADFET